MFVTMVLQVLLCNEATICRSVCLEEWNRHPLEIFQWNSVFWNPHHVPGGGVTPLYGLYRYVRPQRVWFFSRFGHK